MALIKNQFNAKLFEGIADDPEIIEMIFSLHEVQSYDVLTLFLKNKFLSDECFHTLLEQLPVLSMYLHGETEQPISNMMYYSMTSLFTECVNSIVTLNNDPFFMPKQHAAGIRVNTTAAKLITSEATPNFLLSSITRSCPVFNFEASNLFPIIEEDENANSLPPSSFTNEEIHDYDELIVTTTESILNYFLKHRFGDAFKTKLINLFSYITQSQAMRQILITTTDIVENVKIALNNPHLQHSRTCLKQIDKLLPKLRIDDDDEASEIDISDRGMISPSISSPINSLTNNSQNVPQAIHRHHSSFSHASPRVHFDPSICFAIPE